MDLHLDTLLHLPYATVETCSYMDENVCLQIRFLNDRISCPYCGNSTDELHQVRSVLVRDLPVFGQQAYLKIPRRQFYCKACQRYPSERLEFMDWERRHTRRYEMYVYEHVNNSSVAQVSREEKLSQGEIQGIFDHQIQGLKKKEWSQPKRLSIDEFSLRKGHKNFVTTVCDIDSGELLSVINSHKQQDIIKVLMQQPVEVREAVTEVSVDMWGGFAKVIKEIFTNASLVYDRFHVMKIVNIDLNKLRKKMGIKDKHSKYLLLKNFEDLDKTQKTHLAQILQKSPCLKIAHELKEEFRAIYEKHQSVKSGWRQMTKWLKTARILFPDAAQTIENHLQGICNYFISRATSGVMEGINTRIKLIMRQGYGFYNFENFRNRLLACFLH